MATNPEELWGLDYGAMTERTVEVSDASRLLAGTIADKMGIGTSKMTRFRKGERDEAHLIITFGLAVAGEGLLQHDPWGIVEYVLGKPGAELPLRARLVEGEALISDPSHVAKGGNHSPRADIVRLTTAA